MLDELKKRLTQAQAYHANGKGGRDALILQRDSEVTERLALAKKISDLELEKRLLHEACETTRKQARELLENLNTEAVQFILEEPTKVKVLHEIKSNLPYDNLVLTNQQEKGYTNPVDEEGGGLADIVSLCTFVAIKSLMGAKNQCPIFLDEPSKYVSQGRAERSAMFLQRLYETSKTQTFVVTHEREFLPNMADKSFLIEMENGQSAIKKQT